MSFDALIAEAAQTDFEGWDFSVFGDRFSESSPSWDYDAEVQTHIRGSRSMLDMGTGGGEFLAALPQLPETTIATEAYLPNVSVAAHTLRPLGVPVVRTGEDEDAPLPFRNNAFDLVVNRHEAFVAEDVARVLADGGVFMTQQVGGRDLMELNNALDGPEHEFASWRLSVAAQELAAAGLTVIESKEEFLAGHFRDIGAVALYLKIAPWHISDYTLDKYRSRLLKLHRRIIESGPLLVKHHRFVLTAVKS